MPRGEHLRIHTDDEILEAFHHPEIQELERNAYLPRELAEHLEIEGEAVRKRLHKMKGERVKTVEISGVTLWALPDVEVWADGHPPEVDRFQLGNVIRAMNTQGRVAGFGWLLLGASLVVFFEWLLLSGTLFTNLWVSLPLLAGGLIYGLAVAFQWYYNPNMQGLVVSIWDRIGVGWP